ncbi:hypothetical protein B0O99DRAFT_684332 [Bisporella sp. PMI_857]|nr:hypothetical protein B0O99DRAFT_684332 [Bisporella sp. PMI_857]
MSWPKNQDLVDSRYPLAPLHEANLRVYGNAEGITAEPQSEEMHFDYAPAVPLMAVIDSLPVIGDSDDETVSIDIDSPTPKPRQRIAASAAESTFSSDTTNTTNPPSPYDPGSPESTRSLFGSQSPTRYLWTLYGKSSSYNRSDDGVENHVQVAYNKQNVGHPMEGAVGASTYSPSATSSSNGNSPVGGGSLHTGSPKGSYLYKSAFTNASAGGGSSFASASFYGFPTMGEDTAGIGQGQKGQHGGLKPGGWTIAPELTMRGTMKRVHTCAECKIRHYHCEFDINNPACVAENKCITCLKARRGLYCDAGDFYYIRAVQEQERKTRIAENVQQYRQLGGYNETPSIRPSPGQSQIRAGMTTPPNRHPVQQPMRQQFYEPATQTPVSQQTFAEPDYQPFNQPVEQVALQLPLYHQSHQAGYKLTSPVTCERAQQLVRQLDYQPAQKSEPQVQEADEDLYAGFLL